MDWISIISVSITAIATCFIAFYSCTSLKLVKAINNQDVKYREDLKDLTKKHQKELSALYQAIVISTLINGNIHDDKVAQLISTFKKYYKGDIPIF